MGHQCLRTQHTCTQTHAHSFAHEGGVHSVGHQALHTAHMHTNTHVCPYVLFCTCRGRRAWDINPCTHSTHAHKHTRIHSHMKGACTAWDIKRCTHSTHAHKHIRTPLRTFLHMQGACRAWDINLCAHSTHAHKHTHTPLRIFFTCRGRRAWEIVTRL